MFIILSVLYTRRSGVPDVIDMKADTPEDVVRHRVDFFNKFNVGRGVNLQQVVSQCQYFIQQWTRYCSHQQPPLTRASCGGEGPFETLQKSWLLSIVKDPVFKGYEFFRDTRGMSSVLQKIDSALKPGCSRLELLMDFSKDRFI